MKITASILLLGALALSTIACASNTDERVGEGSAAQNEAPRADAPTGPVKAPEESAPCTLRDRAHNLPCTEPSPTAPSTPPSTPTPTPTDPPPASPPPPSDPPAVCDNARASKLSVTDQQCVSGGVLVTFAWTAANAGDQWIDVAWDANALFELDTARGFQNKDLGSRSANIAQLLLPKTTSYAWRINTVAVGLGSQQNNWCPNAWEPGTSFTTIACP